jgi:predicted RNA binding protein YcfA (HicA-like mRNA interferase family)
MSTVNVERVLVEQGFNLVRQRKHRVYRRCDGKTFVMASTPSDRRASQNSLSNLARLLGIPRRELFGKPEATHVLSVAPILVAAQPIVAVDDVPVVEEVAAALPVSSDDSELHRLLKRDERERRKAQRKAAAQRHEDECKFVLAVLCEANLRSVLEPNEVETALREYIDVSISGAPDQQTKAMFYFVTWNGREHVFSWKMRGTDDALQLHYFWDSQCVAFIDEWGTSTQRLYTHKAFREWFDIVLPEGRA